MIITVKRQKVDHRCTMGTLSIDGVLECYTVERSPVDEQHPSIPAGSYPASIYASPHLKRDVILLHAVPGRSMIEVHPANGPGDLLGCIGVGLQQDERACAVYESRLAFIQLIGKVKVALAKNTGVTIVVEDPSI